MLLYRIYYLQGLDLSSTPCSELFPKRRISYRGAQRFAAALAISRVFCVNPEDWKSVQFASFNVV